MKKALILNDIITLNGDIEHFENRFAVIDFSQSSKSKGKYFQMNQPLGGCCVFMVTKGEVNTIIDSIPYCLKKNMILMIEGQRVIDSFYTSEDCEGYCVIFDDDYLEMLVHEEKPPRELMTEVWVCPVVEMNQDDFIIIRDAMKRVLFNLRRSGHAFLSGMLKNELRSLHYEIWNLLFQKKSAQSDAKSPYEKTAMRFIQLLHDNFRKEHEVTYYASELCVSPVFLTRAMKKVTRKTAGQWINEVLAAESRILLRKPGSSIKEIAYELCFSDHASFSKFFKKNTGMSPSKYKTMPV
jgi:AraC-like DNA-binding protein